MARKPSALELLPVEGTGNRFLLLDGLSGPVPDNPGGLALALCRAQTGSSYRPDGLLLLERPSADAPQARVRMVLYNADGTRPEACGNGLRCIARVAVRRRHAQAGEFVVETDAGLRRVRLEPGDGPVTVEMGAAQVEADWHEPEGLGVRGRRVSMGNPHFVLEPRAWTDADVARLGPALGAHADFPGGVNVGFPTRRAEGGLDLRVFERGVGETGACGTGACAAAAALEGALGHGPCAVHLPGGSLEIERDGAGALWLMGGVSVGG